MQRGKARPKTSRASRSNNTVRFLTHDHVGAVPRMTTPDNQVFTVVQSTGNGLLQQTSSFVSVATSVSLSTLAQASSFATLFDQYRIDEIQVILRPMFLSTQLSGSTTFYEPCLYVVVDYDDATALSNALAFEAYSNCNISMYETVSFTYKPHAAMAAYSGAVFTSFANVQSPWIDMASPTVAHYGHKFGVDAGGAGQTSFQSWVYSTRMRVSFRNVR